MLWLGMGFTQRCRSGGLVTEKGCRRLVVRDFASSDNEFDGLACYQTADSRFTGLDLRRNKSAGISTDQDFDHNTISHVRMFNNGSHGIFMRNSSHNSFQHLQVKSNGRAAIFVDPVDKRRHTGSVGNHFTTVVVAACGGPGFQVNATSCKKQHAAPFSAGEQHRRCAGGHASPGAAGGCGGKRQRREGRFRLNDECAPPIM